MTVQTTLPKSHQTLSVSCSKALSEQARWLLDLLTKMNSTGKEMFDGTTIQLGWSILSLRSSGSTLCVCEPNFDTNPFRETRDDLTCTLTIQAQQNEVLRKLGLDGVPAVFDEKIVLSKECLSMQRVYLERSAGNVKGDSGWFVGPAESAPKRTEHEAVYVYQLLRLRPTLMQVLALPPGFMVVLDGNLIEAVLNERNENLWR